MRVLVVLQAASPPFTRFLISNSRFSIFDPQFSMSNFRSPIPDFPYNEILRTLDHLRLPDSGSICNISSSLLLHLQCALQLSTRHILLRVRHFRGHRRKRYRRQDPDRRLLVSEVLPLMKMTGSTLMNDHSL